MTYNIFNETLELSISTSLEVYAYGLNRFGGYDRETVEVELILDKEDYGLTILVDRTVDWHRVLQLKGEISKMVQLVILEVALDDEKDDWMDELTFYVDPKDNHEKATEFLRLINAKQSGGEWKKGMFYSIKL